MPHSLHEEVASLTEAAWFRFYRDPENSEVSEERTLATTILRFKPSKDAEIIQNGVPK